MKVFTDLPRGGSAEVANCESCHGNHSIKPSSDTSSTINKKNLPKTCGKCHEGRQSFIYFKDSCK
ncbi:MAG: hypothetical protein IPI04_02735 [Ignavibacteria bacterium]|nr:hypothetical protein [Ignavibacteria bacterium]